MAEALSPRPSDGVLIQALREPDELVRRWHNGRPYGPGLFVLLAVVAVVGTAAYGALLGLPGSPEGVLSSSLRFTAAAALSWLAPLPAVYILNSLSGSRLRLSTTFLAALLTAAWGGLGFLALLPTAGLILWTVPGHWVGLVAHLTVFAVVAGGMAVVYNRLQSALEPERSDGRSWWLWLFVLLQIELLYAFGLLKFTMSA